MPNWDLRDQPADDIESDGSNQEDQNEDQPQPEDNLPQSEDDPTPSTSEGHHNKGQLKKSQAPKFGKVSADERSKILDFFKVIIQAKKCIGKKQASSYIRTSKSGCEWEQVKTVVNNKVQYLQRQEKKKAKQA